MTQVILIGGPTASGKSSLAVTLCALLNGVVINADSQQLYQGLPLLTAQPDPQDIDRIPHRLYACLSAKDTCSVTQWRDMALQEIAQITRENKLPVLVGGTGFYLKTLLEGISPIPDVPDIIRTETMERQQELGNPAFHTELGQFDPVMAERLSPNDTQRLIRAYEIYKATGKSLSHWQSLPPEKPPAHLSFTTLTVLPPRDYLYERCDKRFIQMMDQGAIEETENLYQHIKNGLVPADAPVTKAIGFHEICALLDGTLDRETAITKAQQRTRNYAKRQSTWFRHQITPDILLSEPVKSVDIKKLADDLVN